MSPRTALTAGLAAALVVAANLIPILHSTDHVVTQAVLRIPATGDPYIHANSTHLATNVASVQRHGTRALYVEFTEPHTAVMHAAATVDESFAAAGYTCGVSGGGAHAYIYCNKPLVDHDLGTMANLWLRIEGIRS